MQAIEEAVNTKTKRHICSWVLLAVFVPMLLFSSLHIHQSDLSAASTCAECIHHHCGGHLAQQSPSLHSCVLCQLLSLPMLIVAVAALHIFNKVYSIVSLSRHYSAGLAHTSVPSLRAPPAMYM